MSRRYKLYNVYDKNNRFLHSEAVKGLQKEGSGNPSHYWYSPDSIAYGKLHLCQSSLISKLHQTEMGDGASCTLKPQTNG